MANPGDKDEQEIREGTEALQQMADEVSSGNVSKGDRKATAQADDTEADVTDEEATTREDHSEESADTNMHGEDEMPMGSVNRVNLQGGGHQM